jgi:hypothetical protein
MAVSRATLIGAAGKNVNWWNGDITAKCGDRRFPGETIVVSCMRLAIEAGSMSKWCVIRPELAK